MRFIRAHKLSIMKQSVSQLSGCKPQVLFPPLLLPVSHLLNQSCRSGPPVWQLACSGYLSNLLKVSHGGGGY